MNELTKTVLFSLLSEPSQATNEEMRDAYGCFMEQIRTVSQSEQNYSEIFRILSVTRAELVFLETLNRYEQGGEMP